MSLNHFGHYSRRHDSPPRYSLSRHDSPPSYPPRRDPYPESQFKVPLTTPGSHSEPIFRGPLTTLGSQPSYRSESSAPVKVKVDWKETPEQHEFKVHLPVGLRRNEVKVEVEGERVLLITGEKTEEREEQNGKWTHVELSKGTFVQRLTLPENANPNHVKAFLENGVLSLTVPKYEVARNYYTRPVSVYGN